MRALIDDHGQRIEAWLSARALERPTHEAIVDGARRLSYAELAHAADAFASALAHAGVKPGDRVAIYLDKTAEAVVAFYGIWRAGAVAVPIHESLRSAQVKHILEDSGSVAVVTEPRKVQRVDEGTFGAARIVEVQVEVQLEVHLSVPALTSPEARALPAGAAPAVILYTSGSTGRPKGILISHDNLLAGARIVSGYLEIQDHERILSVLPFSFDYGLNQLLTAIRQGATLVLQRSSIPADVCRALEEHSITALAGVPPFWIQLMARHSPFHTKPWPLLRYITNSGGVFPVELVARYRAHLPQTRVVLMYGLSEAFRSTYLPPEQLDRKSGSMGRAIPECTIFVVDDDNRACAPGTVGQLVHQGPTVALGYWRDDTKTAAVFRPHPFAAELNTPPDERVVYSGDLVKMDEEGFLFFVGRRDQMIKSSGFRISPEEVEELVQRSGLVAEVVARGVPDDIAGALVELHVVPRNTETFTTELLMTFCRREMPRYMLPAKVHVHSDMPRTSSGKVDRTRVGSP